jgi:hypothetical protein
METAAKIIANETAIATAAPTSRLYSVKSDYLNLHIMLRLYLATQECYFLDKIVTVMRSSLSIENQKK